MSLTDEEKNDLADFILNKLMESSLLESKIIDLIDHEVGKNTKMPESNGSSHIINQCNQVTEIIIRCGPSEAIKDLGVPCVNPYGIICPPSYVPDLEDLDPESQEKLKSIAIKENKNVKHLFDDIRKSVVKDLIIAEIDSMVK